MQILELPSGLSGFVWPLCTLSLAIEGVEVKEEVRLASVVFLAIATRSTSLEFAQTAIESSRVKVEALSREFQLISSFQSQLPAILDHSDITRLIKFGLTLLTLTRLTVAGFVARCSQSLTPTEEFIARKYVLSQPLGRDAERSFRRLATDILNASGDNLCGAIGRIQTRITSGQS